MTELFYSLFPSFFFLSFSPLHYSFLPPPCNMSGSSSDYDSLDEEEEEEDPLDASFISLIDQVQEKFSDACDIFSKDGVTKDELLLTMRYISLLRHHDIVQSYSNKNSIFFYCEEVIKNRKVKDEYCYFEKPIEIKGEQLTSKNTEQHEQEDSDEAGCGFFLSFICDKKTGMWVLRKDGRNSVGKECNKSYSPRLCMHQEFIATLIKRHLFDIHFSLSSVPVDNVLESLTEKFEFTPSKRTLERALKIVLEIDPASILDQNQKIESYFTVLNKNGHFGVVLYSSNELVVPNSDGKTVTTKRLVLSSKPLSLCPLPGDARIPYLDNLPTIEPKPEAKYVSMSFQAVGPAVRAFQYSIPVICLDACRISSYHTEGVILSATFATTEFNLLTMCTGTAESESTLSWDFFLANLRLALAKYCPELKWSSLVFMSDRHRGLINAVKRNFPRRPHLFCVWHLLLNNRCSGMTQKYFWNAVEAENEIDFNYYFSLFVKSVPKAKSLLPIKDQWARHAVSKKCKRYCVRTNNWAESQNNAIRYFRDGSILIVLQKSFAYTSEKFQQYQQHAVKRFSDVSDTDYFTMTDHANRLLKKNQEARKESLFTSFLVGTNAWIVKEDVYGTAHYVKINEKEVSCTCTRFYDEGIPCPHILHVIYSKRLIDGHQESHYIASFIDPIYRASYFKKAFPKEMTCEPGDISALLPNKYVILPPMKKTVGHPQERRFLSKGEVYTGKERVSFAYKRRRQYSGKNDKETGKATNKPIQADIYCHRTTICKHWGDLNLHLAAGDFIPDVRFPETQESPPTDEDNDTDSAEPVINETTFGAVEMYYPDEVDSVDEESSSTGSVQESLINTTQEGESLDILSKPRVILNTHACPQEPHRKTRLPTASVTFPPVPTNDSDKQKGHDVNSKDSHQDIGELPEKRSRTMEGDIDTDEQDDACDTKTKSEKLSPLFDEGEPDFESWKGYYILFQDKTETRSISSRNRYPDIEHPALIPLIYPLPEHLAKSLKRNGKILETVLSSEKATPVISSDLILTFLSFLHLNTVVGVQSQAFAYSHTLDEQIWHLGIPTQDNDYAMVPFKNEGLDKRFFASFMKQESSEKGKYILRCWIITHPTTDVLLTDREIIQLYRLTCENKDCFCVVISPRKKGVKMVCVKLTKEGLNEIRKLERKNAKGPKSDQNSKLFSLECAVSASDVALYCQIPCRFGKYQCVCCDLRGKDCGKKKLGTFVLSGHTSLIW